MRFLIERWLPAAMAAGILGLAAPALAQPVGPDVSPILFQGDASAAQIAAACGITTVRGFLEVQSPFPGPNGSGDFTVNLTIVGEKLDFEDTSVIDQFLGTPTIEAVGMRRNSTNIYCYPIGRVIDDGLDAPGSGSTNEVTFVWGPGPCPLVDTTAACAAYDGTANPPDYLQGHVVGPSQPVNFCGCGGNQVVDCDPALPVGVPGSCNPQGDALAGVESTVAGTAGTSTCEQVTTSVGGRLRTMTVCDCGTATTPPCP